MDDERFERIFGFPEGDQEIRLGEMPPFGPLPDGPPESPEWNGEPKSTPITIDFEPYSFPDPTTIPHREALWQALHPRRGQREHRRTRPRQEHHLTG